FVFASVSFPFRKSHLYRTRVKTRRGVMLGIKKSIFRHWVVIL
ncbi:hypothetical protein LINGRAHAP2_LOCUS20330, partial [Linum grandiflorum]